MAKISRNEPCPCGSGNRFKNCCGSLERSPGGNKIGAMAAGLSGSTGGEQLESLARAAGAGDPAAAAHLGLRYLLGTDVPPDPERGLALIERAALAGDAQGSSLAATVSGASFWRPRDWDAALRHLMRASQQGHQPSQISMRILAGGPAGDTIESDDWSALHSRIDLAAWLAPPAVRVLREAPRIQVIEKFAPPAACDWLIEQARGQLSRATIYDKATGGDIEDDRRINSQCDLGISSCGLLTFILRARIAAITNRPDQAMEIPKVLHYAPGQTFADHFDYLDPGEPAYATELAGRGQRTETFLIYLNEDYSGGETHFSEINISHKGAKGDALLFANIDDSGEPDRDTKHAGLPPTSGEKWLFSQWIRELPRV